MPIFFEEYEALKSSERWQEIIDLGINALKDDEITDKDKAFIKAKSTSCYYYLGKYTEANQMATEALENAKKAGDSDLCVRSLYLISATYRALASQASGTQHEQYKKLSHDNIREALDRISNSEVCNFTKAKVFFNAGALYHDLNCSYEMAEKYYQQAIELFQSDSDDYNRCVIRNIRLMMDNKRIGTADELIFFTKKIEENINKETRTGVQFLQLLSKLFLSFGKYDKALEYADRALKTAAAKSMHAELGMLNQVIVEIKNKESNNKNVSSSEASTVEEKPGEYAFKFR
ncbi:MAG: hypothetical protein REH83_01695 [Rickettsiella sp.]|nr:hypothetical protein [Rickettsiella sp.]